MTVRSARSRLVLLGAGVSLALVSACSIQKDDSGKTADDGSGQGSSATQVSKSSAAKITSNVQRGARNVDLGRKVRLGVTDGTFSDVQVTGPAGAVVAGRLSADKTHWVSTAGLQQASRYRVVGSAVDDEGLKAGYESVFRTRKLTLDEQTFPSFVPLQGQTVGVGHAGDHPVRRPRHRQGRDREAPVGGQQPGSGGFLPLDQRQRGALAAAHVLEAGHERHRQGRHRRRLRRQRHLRPEEPHHVVPRRPLADQQGQHGHRPDAGLPERQADPDDPDHDRRSSRSSPPARAPR